MHHLNTVLGIIEKDCKNFLSLECPLCISPWLRAQALKWSGPVDLSLRSTSMEVCVGRKDCLIS